MKSILYVLSIAVIVLIGSCTAEDPVYQTFEPVDYQASHSTNYFNNGLGDNPGIPAGSLYSFPAGIEIVGFVHGNAPAVSSAPQFDKEKNLNSFMPVSDKSYVEYGYGSLVNLYFTLENTTNQQILVTIPKGTICHEADHDPQSQHGLLVKTVEIPVPANGTVDIHLKLFCVNAHHGIAIADDPYKIGVITVNPDLLTVCNILNAKSTIDSGDYGTIQSIIWKITDNGGFSQADIDLLNAM
ncbi:MAG: hypothetical protein JXR53_08750 [Bacteroidales bacterium]|nr:hypothetical protein [Bacteroidales bacterium]